MNTFRQLLVVFAAWTSTFRAHGARIYKKRATGDHAMRKAEDGTTLRDGSLKTLHVIGDTHGDENYLIRCLLSTELFYMRLDKVEWRRNVDMPLDFQVVILGDMVDGGLSSKKVLRTLYRLNMDKTFGTHMHVLLGNHEHAILQYRMDELAETDDIMGDWGINARKRDMRATSGPDYELMLWLRTRKVAHFFNGALMMHGGLELEIASQYLRRVNESYSAPCDIGGAQCAKALVHFFNRQAIAYYKTLHDCILAAKPATFGRKRSSVRNALLWGHLHRASDCKFMFMMPLMLNRRKGILNFRGYSSALKGAGSRRTCKDARDVAEYIGAASMVVAHTTHAYMMRFCGSEFDSGNVPIIAVDTHRPDCMVQYPPECDFNPSYDFHGRSIDRMRKNVPQSLRMVNGQASQACLSSAVQDGNGSMLVNVNCEPVLRVDFDGRVQLPANAVSN